VGTYHRRMGRFLSCLLLCSATLTFAQQAPSSLPSDALSPVVDDKPLPPIRELLLDVERNQKAAEAARKDYTYHVHLEEQDLDGKGNLKKTTVTDSESLTISGVRINRVTGRNGKELTPDEQKKENDKVDKEVAKYKQRREKEEGKGQETDTRGDVIIPVSRILELGSFTNPRRVDLNGRSTIIADYAGDPNAKTHNPGEGIIRDLVGTVWIDEHDRMLVQGEGHFLNDFKMGGGLLLNIHKGFSFTFKTIKINGEVWLPATVDAQGSARVLLFEGVNGRVHLVTSDYRKFHTQSTITGSSEALGPDDQPVPEKPTAPPQP
jgi:hypothetical protein